VSADSPTRRGPDLPYSVVAGVTPCRGGWLVAGAKLQGTIFAPEDPVRLDSFIDVIDMRPGYSSIALNAPVGGLDQASVGGRTCDREARALLGRRGSAVKSAPIAVDTPDGTSLLPDNVDAITRTLLPRYQEVAREMAPFRQRTIYEANADLSFFQMNEGVPMRWSKYSEKGVLERRTLLESKLPGLLRIIDAEVPGASPSHLLDAAAILWTARRIFAKAALRIPTDPEWDEQGIRMELLR
jgi:predicted RNase H-like nuclease